MKRFKILCRGVSILIVISLLSVTAASAQSSTTTTTVTKSSSVENISTSQVPLRMAKDMYDVRVGVGLLPALQIINLFEKSLIYGPDRDYYYGNKVSTPAVNLFFGYQFERWLNFGVIATYAGAYRNSYDLNTDIIRSRERDYYFAFTPSVRFDWVRSNVVRLYSSVGFGIACAGESDNYINGKKYSDSEIIMSIDATPIGISVGRRLFFFSELSFGFNGILKCGIGYRFFDKRR